jgi:hypothetical protein
MTLVNCICNYLYPTAEMLQAAREHRRFELRRSADAPYQPLTPRIFGIDRAIASLRAERPESALSRRAGNEKGMTDSRRFQPFACPWIHRSDRPTAMIRFCFR